MTLPNSGEFGYKKGGRHTDVCLLLYVSRLDGENDAQQGCEQPFGFHDKAHSVTPLGWDELTDGVPTTVSQRRTGVSRLG